MSEEEKEDIDKLLKEIRERAKNEIALEVEDLEEDEKVQRTRKKIDRLKRRD